MKCLSYILLLLIVAACSKKNIETWEGDRYIYFTVPEDNKETSNAIDSIDLSFFFYLEDEIEYPLEVALTGQLLEEDTPFKVVVDKEKTTLPEDLYELPELYTFSKGQVKDTITIKLKNSSILKDNKYSLKIDIVDYGRILTHKGKNGSRRFSVSDTAIRPVWWPEGGIIEEYYLGKYSDTKYKKFMEVTEVSELDLDNLAEARLLVLEFQHWLDNQDPKIKDEDGNDMSTKIIG